MSTRLNDDPGCQWTRGRRPVDANDSPLAFFSENNWSIAHVGTCQRSDIIGFCVPFQRLVDWQIVRIEAHRWHLGLRHHKFLDREHLSGRPRGAPTIWLEPDLCQMSRRLGFLPIRNIGQDARNEVNLAAPHRGAEPPPSGRRPGWPRERRRCRV